MIVGPRSNYLLRFLPRLFSKAGAEVVMAAPSGSSILSSRYIKHLVEFDSAQDNALVKLDSIVSQWSPDYLIVIEEPLLCEIADAPQGSLEALKSRFSHLDGVPLVRSEFHFWAESRGIRVPDGRMVASGEELQQAVLEWGCVYLKRNHSSGGNGVFRLSHPDQVQQVWSRIPSGEQVLVQRALQGRVGVTDMVCKNGRLLAWASSEKWKTVHDCGPSVARRLCDPEGMEDLARSVACETGFNGLCGFDWVIDLEDGLPSLIEFHPRPPSGYGIGKWAGVYYEKAIAGMLGMAEAEYQKPKAGHFRKKSVCCYFPDHPLACIRQRDWSELRRWLPGSNSRSWSLLPWDDPSFLFQIMLKAFGRR